MISNGFEADDLETVRAALLRHGKENEIAAAVQTAYGVKYCVDGPMPAPGSRTVAVRTVWQIDVGQKAPRFVTLKPIGVVA